VDGVDYNLYLTRRLHEIPNRTSLTRREICTDQDTPSVLMVDSQKTCVRRSK
jgi:hypothetical protein